MIRSLEIKEKAREYGVPVSTIERDYAQNWLLKYLYHPNIILKGGTGIKKIYIGDYRFSDDLDFSLSSSMRNKDLFFHIDEAVKRAKEEVGINFQLNSELLITETGIRGKIYFNIIQNVSGTPLSIKIDITDYDNEIILLPLAKKEIIHSYSDTLNAEIKVYSLEEIFAEKIRAIIQRTRARDLYDIVMLDGLVDLDKVLQILEKKFYFKNVIFTDYSLMNRKNYFLNAWEKSLRHQLKEISDFEISFNKAVEIINKIKSKQN